MSAVSGNTKRPAVGVGKQEGTSMRKFISVGVTIALVALSLLLMPGAAVATEQTEQEETCTPEPAVEAGPWTYAGLTEWSTNGDKPAEPQESETFKWGSRLERVAQEATPDSYTDWRKAGFTEVQHGGDPVKPGDESDTKKYLGPIEWRHKVKEAYDEEVLVSPEVPAIPEVWANFQPKHSNKPFVGPPAYPTDPRGTWKVHDKIPGGHAGDDGVYAKGNPAKGGNWFYRKNGQEGQPAKYETVHHEAEYETDSKWKIKVRDFIPGQAEVKEYRWKKYTRTPAIPEVKCEVSVPAEPQPAPSTCEVDGSLDLTPLRGVNTFVNDVRLWDADTFGPGTYEVIYRPAKGYLFDNGKPNVKYTVTVDAKTNDCPATILTSPKVDPVCTAEGEDVVTQGTGEHVTWKQTPTQVVDGRTKYRFVATPDEGYVLPAEGDWDKVVDGKAVWEIWVANEDCALPAPPAPQPVPPTCDEGGYLDVAPMKNVIVTVNGSEVTEPTPFTEPGTYTVTFEPVQGYDFPMGTQTEYIFEVEPATGDCPTDEETPPTDEEEQPKPPTKDEEEQPKPDEPTKAEKPVVRKAAVVAQAGPAPMTVNATVTPSSTKTLPNTGGPHALALLLAASLLGLGTVLVRRRA